jgi:hypothetical protein
MFTNPFDEFTKSLASVTSRRSVLKALATAIGGGAVVLLGASSEAAQKDTCRQAGQSCNKHQDCCTGLACLPKKQGNGHICG